NSWIVMIRSPGLSAETAGATGALGATGAVWPQEADVSASAMTMLFFKLALKKRGPLQCDRTIRLVSFRLSAFGIRLSAIGFRTLSGRQPCAADPWPERVGFTRASSYLSAMAKSRISPNLQTERGLPDLTAASRWQAGMRRWGSSKAPARFG